MKRSFIINLAWWLVFFGMILGAFAFLELFLYTAVGGKCQ